MTIVANETFKNGTVVSFFNQIPDSDFFFFETQNLPFAIGSPEEVACTETISWLASNQAFLSEKHGDHWVLIDGQTVIGESNDPADLERLAASRNIRDPLITKVPAPSPNWRTAYAVCR